MSMMSCTSGPGSASLGAVVSALLEVGAEEAGASAEARLRQLGIELPKVAVPTANYVPATRLGNLVFLAGQPDKAPMTVRIPYLLSTYGQEYNLLSAASFLLMIVPLIVFFALQRYFVQGLLAGSVKT